MPLSPTIIAGLLLAIFALGLGLGYLYTRESEESQKQKLRTLIAVVVTLVWVVAMVADILITGYTISPMVHAIMGAVVGYFFAEKGLNINIGE